MELNLQAYLDYNKTFGKHTVGALLGYSQIYNQMRYLQASRKNLPNSNTLDQINAGEVTTQTTYGTETEYSLRSVFGRLNYSYDDRYLFSATVRRDGSSRLSKNIRWGTFPSVSLGWRFDKETFFPFNRNIVNMFKVRASYGELGNENIGEYMYQAVMARNNMTYSFGNTPITGSAISTS